MPFCLRRAIPATPATMQPSLAAQLKRKIARRSIRRDIRVGAARHCCGHVSTGSRPAALRPTSRHSEWRITGYPRPARPAAGRPRPGWPWIQPLGQSNVCKAQQSDAMNEGRHRECPHEKVGGAQGRSARIVVILQQGNRPAAWR